MEAELKAILDEWEKDFKTKEERTRLQVATEAAEKLRAASPRRPGSGEHYADGWTVDVDKYSCTIHNKTKPSLTHLLERGHAKVNGGRVKAKPHIKKVERWANRELIKRLENDG